MKVLCEFAGQLVQIFASSPEKVLALQLVHSVAAIPEKVPGRQFLHPKGRTSVLVLPARQLEQIEAPDFEPNLPDGHSWQAFVSERLVAR